jgi:hypothetical protein
MHVDKFYKDETSGKRIYSILFEGEDCHDLENVGEGRAKTPDRWVSSQYAELLMAFREDRIEFIAFTRMSAKVCARGNYGLGRHLFIREAAIAHLKAVGDNPNPKVDTPSFETYLRSPKRGPYRPRQTHHHVRPKGIGTG